MLGSYKFINLLSSPQFNINFTTVVYCVFNLYRINIPKKYLIDILY